MRRFDAAGDLRGDLGGDSFTEAEDEYDVRSDHMYLNQRSPEYAESLLQTGSRRSGLSRAGEAVAAHPPASLIANAYSPYYGMDARLAHFVNTHNVVMDDGAIVYTGRGGLDETAEVKEK